MGQLIEAIAVLAGIPPDYFLANLRRASAGAKLQALCLVDRNHGIPRTHDRARTIGLRAADKRPRHAVDLAYPHFAKAVRFTGNHGENGQAQ